MYLNNEHFAGNDSKKLKIRKVNYPMVNSLLEEEIRNYITAIDCIVKIPLSPEVHKVKVDSDLKCNFVFLCSSNKNIYYSNETFVQI